MLWWLGVGITFFSHFLGFAMSIGHGRNLIWAQTPAIKVFSNARLVGIQGDPHIWVANRNPQVTYISAPHYTWEFSALSFNWNDQVLYWSENTFKKIQGLRLNGSRETMTIVSGTSSEVYGIAVDWLSGNLYYTDALYNWIMMASAEVGKTGYRIIVNEGLDNPHGIAVHPSQGRLFWSDWGARPKIETASLLGMDRRILVDWDMIHPKGLTIDLVNEELYWVDTFKATVESIGLNGQGRTVLHTEEGSSFYGLALYNDLIFVSDKSKDGMLKVFNRKQKLVSFTLSNIPFDVIMYEESRQPGNSTECQDLGCQQLCVLDPDTGPACLCGEGYVIDEADKTSCIYTKQFIHPSHIYAIGDSVCQYPANIADMSLINVTLDSQCFLERRQEYMTLTFDARNHFLYYFGNKTRTISRIPLELGGKAQVMAGGMGLVNGMALDWVSGNLYWTDVTHGVIRMCSQDCSYQVVILDRLGSPFGIAVHPGRGKIYWTDHGHPPDVGSKVESANLDGTGREIVMDDNLGTPNHIFIDFKKDNLYWSDSRLHHVRMLDLNNGRITVVMEQPNVRFYGISVFQDFLLWTDQDDLNGIHVARMDKKEKIRGIIHPKNGVASDLITFDVGNQPDFDSPCAPNMTKCSQLCVTDSDKAQKCLCGSGFQLDEDGFSCTTLPVWDNFLLVNDGFQRQIFQINLVNGVLGAINLKLQHQPIALAYDPYDFKVFWTDNKVRVISEATIEGRYQKILLRFNETSKCNGLAADYVNRLVFYTDDGNDVIGVVSMGKEAKNTVLIDTDLDNPRDIMVSPHDGTIYWTDWGKKPRIEKAFMDGTGREDVVAFDNQAWLNGLALDAKAQNLYWVDASADVVSVINLQTREIKQLLHEPGSHYFSIVVSGDYLYINDWKRNYLVRMNKKGGYLRRYGDTVFTRLYAMDGFNSSESFRGPSVCASSACEHLCLPKDKGQYSCVCSQGYLPKGNTCVEAPTTTTILTTPTTTTTTANNDTFNSTTQIVGSTPATTAAASTTAPTFRTSTTHEQQSTSPPEVTITRRPTTTVVVGSVQTSGIVTGSGIDTTISATATAAIASTDDPGQIHASKSSLAGSAGLSTTAIIIICTILAVTIVAVIVVVVVVVIRRRRRRLFFPHDKLVESRSPSISKIVYSGTGTDDMHVSLDGGIENPTYDCLHNMGPGTSSATS